MNLNKTITKIDIIKQNIFGEIVFVQFIFCI